MKLEPNLIKWRSGYPSQVDASKAYVEIERIRQKNNGQITPEDVIAVAVKPRNVLHKAFQWDEETAASEYRLEQARGMLRSFVVIRSEAPKEPSRVYEIERIAAENDSEPRTVYRTTEDILKDPVTRACLLQRALGELTSCQRKYRQLSELAVVFRAIDDVLVTIEV